jgi:hypothetical protein
MESQIDSGILYLGSYRLRHKVLIRTWTRVVIEVWLDVILMYSGCVFTAPVLPIFGFENIWLMSVLISNVTTLLLPIVVYREVKADIAISMLEEEETTVCRCRN